MTRQHIKKGQRPVTVRTASKHAVRTVISLATAAALTGCSGISYQNPSPEAAAEQFKKLMQRPDIEDVTSHYEQLHAQVRAAISADFTNIRWQTEDQTSRAGCGSESGFADINVSGRTDAESRRLPLWYAPGGIPAANWVEAKRKIESIARDHGFSEGRVLANKPNTLYRFTLNDQNTATLSFTTGGGQDTNSLLSISTGCHLTREAKNRGHLAPIKTY